MSDSNYEEIMESYRLLENNSSISDSGKNIHNKIIDIKWKKVGIYILTYFISGMIIVGILNPKMIRKDDKFNFKKFLFVSSMLTLGIIGINFLVKYIMYKIQ